MNFDLIKDMFPGYFKKENVNIAEDTITIYFSSTKTSAPCPSCGGETNDITTYFTRVIQDLPIIEKRLVLNIRLKKFRCNNLSCKTKVFSENISGFAGLKQRNTNRLNEKLTIFSLTYSAEGAARILLQRGINISGDTLLRLSRKWKPDIDPDKVIAVGIDDFALKKTSLWNNYYQSER